MLDEVNQLPVYVISLSNNVHRRKSLERKFKYSSTYFQYIDAVNGGHLQAKEYFSSLLHLYHSQGRLMTPSEVGCALSHVEALKVFLGSKNSHALILEDDVIGTDESIADIRNIAPKLPENSILIAGGQDGIKSPYLLGKASIEGTSELAELSFDYIYRACCYVVTRESAKLILEQQSAILTIADWWGVILKNTGIKIYYKSLMQHPLDLADSNLELDRVALSNKKDRKGFFSKELFRLIRKIKVFYLIVRGNRRL